MAAPSGEIDAVVVEPRFNLVDEEELEDFISSTDSENTRKQIKYGLAIFNEYCRTVGVNYEGLDNADLDKLLSRFYAGARSKKGSDYSSKTMHSIRFALQRHFLATRGVNIKQAQEYALSNRTFKATLVKLKAKGKAVVKHHPSISEPDMKLIQESLDITKPKQLQHKVFVDCMLYFANRGMENLRVMKPSDFVLQEENGHEYFTLKDMSTKNHRADEEVSQGGQMHQIAGNPRCPVQNLKYYLSKLNPLCDCVWQKPRQGNVQDSDQVWYENVPIGKNTLELMMKKISEAAGCSKLYTNHSLRATSITILDQAGYSSRHIMSVSGHRTESSIKNYARTSDQHKKDMSNTLSGIVQPSRSQPEPLQVSIASNINSESEQTSTSENVDPAMLEDTDFTDSQLERALNSIPNSYPLQVQDSNVGLWPSSQTQSHNVSLELRSAQPQTFSFHGCTVHIYDK